MPKKEIDRLDVYEVKEHEEIGIPLERLIVGGEFALDERIEKKGYLTVAIAQGRLQLKTTRFVGLIPLNEGVAVKVIPKATIRNLSKMIVKSGTLPTVLEGFSRGYRPNFELSEKAVEIYHESLLSTARNIVSRGLMKGYIQIANPPKWRGRMLVSDTVNRFVAKGIRYDGVFDFRTLSFDILENRAIKAAINDVVEWLKKRPAKETGVKLGTANEILAAFTSVSDAGVRRDNLLASIPKMAKSLPLHMQFYSEPLWTAYAILQGSIPDVKEHGYIAMDSMIVNVSEVFESYARKAIEERAENQKLRVTDGNLRVNQRRFFSDGDEQYNVMPDIIVERGDDVVAVLDVKYKPSVREQDRYQLLAFMEATGANFSAFVCPRTSDAEPSRFLGRTAGGRNMGIIRFDLGVDDLVAEEDRLFRNTMRLVEGSYDFE